MLLELMDTKGATKLTPVVTAILEQKFLGEWREGVQTGLGTAIDINGVFRQGEWLDGTFKKGIVVCPSPQEPDSYVEFVGEMAGNEISKGQLWLNNRKICLSGSFSGNIYQGTVNVAEAQLVLNKPAPFCEFPGTDEWKRTPEASQWTYAIEKRWQPLIDVFMKEELGSVDGFETSVAIIWSNLVGSMRIGKELVSGDLNMGFCDALETISKYGADWNEDYYRMVAEYWRLAMDNSYHPLYRIFHGFVQVFNTSYSGMAAHKNLHGQALLELDHIMSSTYGVMRKLFPNLPEDGNDIVSLDGHTPENSISGSSDEDEASENARRTSSSSIENRTKIYIPLCNFVYEDFFLHCSPVVFTICSLASNERDDIYWNRVVYLNAHTDMKLLSYLEVPRDLWPIDIPMEMADLDKPNKRHVARNKFYQPAVVGLQHMTTHSNPVEKLNSLHRTFDLIQEVLDFIGFFG
ncbi:unnamed protein product [Caenorhabditis auriculariae]|uniref:Alsin helical array domain-containing protein n=1 Tax=Caenorhabditis auriculariae TaxID=2777116 RepID=A0A8S1H2S5_9PELO|nr:unnamed protein product [Caenorhabditis auriculariae]